MRVLVVEDDPNVRELIAEIVEDRGHSVEPFGDGESAWRACQREAFPLMILDWILPGIDGLEVCRRARSGRDGDTTVVVVITARGRPEDLAAVLDAGADDYVTKPFDLGALDTRLAIAERHVAARIERWQAREAMREADRLQGALMTAATVEHNLGNQLALTMGYAELLAINPALPDDLRAMAERALDGVLQANETLDKLRRITRLERSRIRGGPQLIDLERSMGDAGAAHLSA